MATSSLGALVLTVALASCWAMVARTNTYDGLPRTKGFPDAPTTAYGAFPAVYLRGTNQTADCEWYGFANVNFPANIGNQCLTYVRARVVEEANRGLLTPYAMFDFCLNDAFCYDRVSSAYYCFHACYFLSNSSLAIPPVTAPAPPAPPPPPSVVRPPGTPAAVLPPPGGSIIGQPPPAPVASRSAGARSHTLSVMLLAFCACAVNQVIRLWRHAWT